MQWEIEVAKNGEQTLKLNNTYIYSRYKPREDAYRWIDAEFDSTKKKYLLIGLGLGYHAERLKMLARDKDVYVFYFEKIEKSFFKFESLVTDISELKIDEEWQVLIPKCWIAALNGHPLEPFLDDIKMKQLSYKNMSYLLRENFDKNIELGDLKRYSPERKKNAAIVSSGPSLNETIYWLKQIKQEVDIYCVGSALKILMKHDIVPKAVVISDPKKSIYGQIAGSMYNGVLLYLSTASHNAVLAHTGERFLLCQNGYIPAEKVARENNLQIFDTGGSVATLAFSLVESLHYERLVFFGQDLGFKGNRTHANESTSGRNVIEESYFKTVISNSNLDIFSTPNLLSYLRWFQKKIKYSDLKVYNTALNGAKIDGATLITEKELYNLVENL
ncbi:motility associated factor glycosyltransferase family protein [Lysinibacillus sp. FSL M8-0134]|uniref:motility associated factor glycosyltransferase family protein n=1 Tax=Lysinibacillus sp. FSL M8-0134 TaxID=2921717 RepID=UPI003119B05B